MESDVVVEHEGGFAQDAVELLDDGVSSGSGDSVCVRETNVAVEDELEHGGSTSKQSV
jgi:hypothetical protein